MAILLILAACEEKIPVIQNRGVFYEFVTLTISADSMNYAQAVIDPGIGQSDVLYIGNDENVYAYTLLKFGQLDNLPDTVGEFISLKLNLRNNHQYRLNDLADESVEIGIYHLKNNGIDPWAEDSSHVNNFNVDDDIYELEYLTHFTYSDSDTVAIDLANFDLINDWYNDVNNDYSLVLRQIDTTIATVQTFYSTESLYYPRLEVSYSLDSDTLTTYILPSEDLSIIEFKKPAESPSLLNINSGQASFGVLKFNFEDLLNNENEYIAKADLYLKIDPIRTQQYDEICGPYKKLEDRKH